MLRGILLPPMQNVKLGAALYLAIPTPVLVHHLNSLFGSGSAVYVKTCASASGSVAPCRTIAARPVRDPGIHNALCRATWQGDGRRHGAKTLPGNVQRAVVMVYVAGTWASGVIIDAVKSLVMTNAHVFVARVPVAMGSDAQAAPCSYTSDAPPVRKGNAGEAHPLRSPHVNHRRPDATRTCEVSSPYFEPLS
jgi:hypothetical protein